MTDLNTRPHRVFLKRYIRLELKDIPGESGLLGNLVFGETFVIAAPTDVYRSSTALTATIPTRYFWGPTNTVPMVDAVAKLVYASGGGVSIGSVVTGGSLASYGGTVPVSIALFESGCAIMSPRLGAVVFVFGDAEAPEDADYGPFLILCVCVRGLVGISVLSALGAFWCSAQHVFLHVSKVPLQSVL